MENDLPYDKTSPQSILNYARKLLGKSLKDIYPNEFLSYKKGNKGGLGQSVEKIHFKYKPNSNSEPDFNEAGVELKCTPLRQTKCGDYISKERLVLNVIDYISEASNDFYSSSFWKKNNLILLMFYLYITDSSTFEYLFKIIRLWSIPKEDLKIFIDDWTIIHNKIKNGLAHELHEGDTLYLSACCKGSKKGAELRKQPCSDIKAQQRAYSIKSTYINQIILDSSSNPEMVHDLRLSEKQKKRIEQQKAEFGNIVRSTNAYKKGQTFEELVIEKFDRFIGKSFSQIESELGVSISTTSKSKSYDLCRAILGVKANKIAEFAKAAIALKTIRLESNGNLKESMSFQNIRYCEIIHETEWSNSAWYNTLTQRFFFVVFKKKKGGTDKDAVLEKVFFWAMPSKDLEKAKSYWLDTRNKIRKGDYEHFLKSTEHEICHVRPKAVNSKDLAPTPQGGFMKKYCYWLNRKYVLNIILGKSK